MSRSGPDLDDVAAQLLASYQVGHAGMQHLGGYELPSPLHVGQIVDQCRALLFPGFAGGHATRLTAAEWREVIRSRVEELRGSLSREVYRAFNHRNQVARPVDDPHCADCERRSQEVVARFLTRLPALRAALAEDVQAAFEGDPAATGPDEIMVCYPGVYAITLWRIANALLREGAVIVPRMMTELAHQRTGIDIHPGASIGRALFIDHGTGVVIGETTVIGDRVRIYQGVTLGALSIPRTEERPAPGSRRHPTLEDDVVIYAGATILGGETVIGKGAVIGGNAFVTSSVPPGARVSGSVSRRERDTLPP